MTEVEFKYHTPTQPPRLAERNAIIEECARVADGLGDKYYFMSAVDIAAAIRALKMNIPLIEEHLRALKDD